MISELGISKIVFNCVVCFSFGLSPLTIMGQLIEISLLLQYVIGSKYEYVSN